MRLFHVSVYDENIEGTTQLYMDPSNNALLGSVEKQSADQINWINKAGTAEINGVAISATQKTITVGTDNGSVPSAGFLRLRVQLGGTTPKAHVRIWVTGRGEQPV